MSKITALRISKGKKRRVNIFLDGKFALSLETELVVKEGLQVGQDLATGEIETLGVSNRYYRCLNAAVYYLGFRPRSESELRERLHRRGFDDNCVGTVITNLKRQGLVDDAAFARFWRDNREAFSPRSRWLTRLELRRNGVAEDVIDQAVDTLDENDSAYRAALSKVRSLHSSDYQSFRHRLGEYLRRRGFGYGVINNTVERLWQEQGERLS